VNYVIGSKAGSRYLIEQRQKCLKVVAVNQGDIGILGHCARSGESAKACAQDNNARFSCL
jgi:hypothetical protein